MTEEQLITLTAATVYTAARLSAVESAVALAIKLHAEAVKQIHERYERLAPKSIEEFAERVPKINLFECKPMSANPLEDENTFDRGPGC